MLSEELANKPREIQEEARARRLQHDLFYRLSVFPLELLPPGSRKDDIPLRAGHLIAQVSKKVVKEASRGTREDWLDFTSMSVQATSGN
jgi:transcriptional regulator with GAF, ATPase, and Fis domain